MELDMNRIKEIFGNSAILEIKDNQEDFLDNIKYLISLGCPNVYELVEIYPYTFLIDTNDFKSKVKTLLDSLGVESFEKIENNLEIWGSLDE